MRNANPGRADLDDIKRRLGENAEALCLELFGQPTKRTAREWRWGRRGSVSVRFGGKAGPSFTSFEADTGGSLLDAIAFKIGCSFPEAIEWAQGWLGDDPHPRLIVRQQAPLLDVETDEQERVAAAEALWRSGRSIDGTAAQKYLASRGIDRWPPDVVRYISAGDVARDRAFRDWQWPAAMFAATNAAGEVRAIQLVAVRDDGPPARDADGNKIKRSRGCLPGTVVRMAGDAGGPLVLAEGPETALSVWLATGLETWACLGSVAKASLVGMDRGRKIIVARDDDPPGAPARRALARGVASWRKDGRTVLDATPWDLSRGDKSDFNDTLLAGGVEAVRARIEAAIPREAARETKPTLETARAVLGDVADLAIRELMSWVDPRDGSRPPFLVANVPVGVGKSERALHAVVDAWQAGFRPVYLAPTHKLTSELSDSLARIAAARGAKPRIAIWRGREAEDPSQAGESMCTQPGLIETATKARVSPAETVCRGCPARASCSYLRQSAVTADIWLGAHELMFHRPPAPMGKPDVLIIDESFAFAGLVGLQGRPTLITREMLERQPEHGSGSPASTADLRASLLPARRALLSVIAGSEPAPLTRCALMDTGLSAEKCRLAARDEWKRYRSPPDLGDNLEAMTQWLEGAHANAEAERMAWLWAELAEVADDAGPDRAGRIALWRSDGAGAVDCLRLARCLAIAKPWRIPTLAIDASADLELIKTRVGRRARLLPTIDVGAPHMTVSQHTGRFGIGALKGNRGQRHLERVWAWCLFKARSEGGRWLFIMNKEIEETIRAKFAVPDFVSLAHFGALRGLNAYRDVRGIIVVGRNMPSPHAVETLRGAISGRAAPETTGGAYYPLTPVTLTASDGTMATVEVERHPDQLTERIRRSVCDDELIQAIGRGRGVQRTDADPLSVYVLGNVPVPGLTLDTMAPWEPLAPDLEFFAFRGIHSSSTSDMAKLMGDASRERLKKARSRGVWGQTYNNNTISLSPNSDAPRHGAYVRARTGRGAGQYQTITYDRRLVPHVRVELEGKLGPLRRLHYEGAPGGVVKCAVTGVLDFSHASTDQSGIGRDGYA